MEGHCCSCKPTAAGTERWGKTAGGSLMVLEIREKKQQQNKNKKKSIWKHAEIGKNMKISFLLNCDYSDKRGFSRTCSGGGHKCTRQAEACWGQNQAGFRFGNLEVAQGRRLTETVQHQPGWKVKEFLGWTKNEARYKPRRVWSQQLCN